MLVDSTGRVVPDFDNSATWLADWIADQLRTGAGRRAIVARVRGDAMYVYGSIATDVALTSAGEVWVADHDFDTVQGTAGKSTWRRAEGLERIGFIVIAARRFTALQALVPDRPATAADCPSCRATGDWHIFSGDRKESLRIRYMICKDCGGLGWRAPVARGLN